MKTVLLASALLLSPRLVMARCPLCTIGAGGAALLAAYLGIGAAPVGVFVGAFALATGLWTARLIRRRFVPAQDSVLGVASFASVVVPVVPTMQQYSSIYVSWMGEYGRTFLVDNFLVGSVVGGALLYVAPYLSRRFARARGNRMFPYKGMLMSLVLLLAAAGTLELAL